MSRSASLTISALGGMPEVAPGDDLGQLISDSIAHSGHTLQDGDILVVTSKIVSKAEGRVVQAQDREDAITRETVRLVASRQHPGGVTRIVENRNGLVMAAAGVDASNTPSGTVLLLPVDPDASARGIAQSLRERHQVRVGVLISDTFGRPWREGQVDVAIGAAGVAVFDDVRGQLDPHGNELHVTLAAIADELSAAADLVKGKLNATPVALVRGMASVVTESLDTPATALVRPAERDLFGLGVAEAIELGAAQERAQRTDEPVFRSLAFADLPQPDFADVIVLPVPAGVPEDPRVWAETIFGIGSMPKAVSALLGLRQVLVRFVGIPPADLSVFAVDRVEGEEALIVADDTHLDFRCGIALDAQARLLRVTTTVQLKGWRGRLYFGPVRIAHPIVVHAMMRKAIRDLRPKWYR